MNKEKDIIVPRWFLEIIEDTLRIQYNINEPDMKETGESCQDRNIKQCLNGARKLLNGEDLTGMERQEKLQSSLPEGLDEAAEKIADDIAPNYPDISWDDCRERIIEGIKAGAEWGRKQVLQEIYDGKTKPVDKITAAWLTDEQNT